MSVVPGSNWLDHLGRKTTPQFGQLVTWLLLATGLILACLPFEIRVGSRQGPVTVFSWLPAEVLSSPATFYVFRALLLAGIALWFWQKWLPWSCWMTVLGFTGVWSMHVENTYNAAHIFHVPNNLLVIQALWVTFHSGEIRTCVRENRYWTTPLMPRWVVLAGIAYIGIFHTAAGLTKLLYSGPAWASGTSLQLWTHLWGHPWAPSTQMILGSRTYTAALQTATLVIETTAVLAIIPHLRVAVGMALLGFYTGVLLTFDYGFHFNALFTVVYLLPVEWWVRRYWARASIHDSPS